MPHTLLLADDSVTIQRVIELTFADEDVRVVAVGDGRQAIDRIFAEPPDIVLADVGMPGCDGYEVSAYVKGRPDLAHIPVLLLTGAFEPVDELRVSEVGADGVLAKPFEPQELISRVKQLLGLGPARAATADDAGAKAGGGKAGRGAGAPRAADEGDEVLPVTGPAVAPPSASAAAGVSLDDYFDRLDAVFASMSVPSHIDEAAAIPGEDVVRPGSPSDAGGGPSTVSRPVRAAAERAPQPPLAAPSGVTPADAFAALLDAERSGRPAEPVAPGSRGIVLPPTYPPIDELVEAVARRVIGQLSEKVVRDAVTESVSAVAERLVRHEIERLKATIK